MSGGPNQEPEPDVFRRFGDDLKAAISGERSRPRLFGLRRSVLAGIAGLVVVVPSAFAIANTVTDQPEPDGPYETVDDCSAVMDLYRTVGMDVGYYYAPNCPSRDDVLRDIANSEPAAGNAELCEKALSDGRAVDSCSSFLRNRERYLQGVSELEAQGIDLDSYRDGP